MKPWLRILRVPLAATAACDACACALLACMAADIAPDALGLGAWLALAATSLLIYGTGMAANDLADLQHDRRLAPSRPLPSGDLRPGPVAAAVAVMAAGALALGGGAFGSRTAVALALALALAYDFGLKRGFLTGVLAMGGVRAANASIAVLPLVVAGHAAWTVLLAPLCIGLYAAGVTVLSTTEERPDARRVWAARILAAVAFAGAATLAWVVGGQPTLGLAVAFGIATSTLFGRTPRPGPPKRMVLEMLLGLYWLAAVLAGGWHAGTLAGAVTHSFVALLVAWVLAVASQLLVRALRKPGTATAGDPPPRATSP